MKVEQDFTDASLVRALQQQGRPNEAAVRFLYQHHFTGLSIYVQQNGGTRQDAEDVFQEVVVTFIEIVQNGRFRGEAGVKTFLFALNRNIWLNEYKKRNRSAARDTAFTHDQPMESQSIQDHISHREAKAQIMQVIGRLGEACKKVLLLFYYENMAMKDILANTDYENEQVLRNKKYKCMKQLEQLIAADPVASANFKTALQHGQ